MSGSTAVVKLPKPELRGALIKQIKVNLFGSLLGATGIAAAWWYYVSRQRKINYSEFHKNHDIDKVYDSMKKAGVFKGLPSE